MSRPIKASAQVKETFAARLPRNLNFTRAPGRIAFRSVTDRSRGSEAGRRRPGRYVIVVAAWRPRLSGREGNAAPSLHAVLHTGLPECDYGEGSEAGVQVPLLPDCSAGGRTVPNVRVRTEGIQPGARRPHRGVVPAGRAGLLRAVVRDADGLEALGRPGLLGEVSSVPLQQALRHLQGAFAAFWENRALYPRFKSRKRSRASAEYTRSAFRWRGGQLTLAKVTEPLGIRWSTPLPRGAGPSPVTVSPGSAGPGVVSLLCECPMQPLPPCRAMVGIDVGLTRLVTLSTGEKVANPRHERADRKRLALSQRRLARKAKGSANRAKAGVKLARVHARITDRRRDFLHKLTTRLVRENQTAVIEDLSVRNMLRN